MVNLNLEPDQLAQLSDFVSREYVTDEIANGSGGHPVHTNFGDNPVPVGTDFFGTPSNSTSTGATLETIDPVNPTVSNIGAGLTGTSNGVFGNAIGPVGAPVQETLNVPENALIIREGASVEALDGHIGKVKEVNLDPDSGQIVSFVVEKGIFILDDYTVPVESVESTNQDQVFVKLTKDDFKNAPLAEDVVVANTTAADTFVETDEDADVVVTQAAPPSTMTNSESDRV